MLPQSFSLFMVIPHLHRCCPPFSFRLMPRVLQFGWLPHWSPLEKGLTKLIRSPLLNFDFLKLPLKRVCALDCLPSSVSTKPAFNFGPSTNRISSNGISLYPRFFMSPGSAEASVAFKTPVTPSVTQQQHMATGGGTERG